VPRVSALPFQRAGQVATTAHASLDRGSGLPPADDRLLLVLLGLAVAGGRADSGARDGAAEAVEPHAPGVRHGAAVGRLLTLASRGRGGSGTFCPLRRVGRPSRCGPERDSGGERPRDERRPPVGPAEPRAPGAGGGAVSAPRAAQARGDHPLAHVLRQPQRESFEVAVEPLGEGVARRVRARERTARPRPHRAALAPDPVQLHRLPPPLLLILLDSVLAAHVDGRLILRLLLLPCYHLAGAARGRLGRDDLLRVEVAPADGAGDVAGEPLPDAVRVEGVAAGGQEPELLVVLELAEADGALERGVLAADADLLSLGEAHGGERRDHRGVEPALLLPLPLLPPRQREQRGGRDGGAARGRAPPAPAHVHGEEADEEEGCDERHEEHHHRRAEARWPGHPTARRLGHPPVRRELAAVVLVPRRLRLCCGGRDHQHQGQRGEEHRRRIVAARRRHLVGVGGFAALLGQSRARGAEAECRICINGVEETVSRWQDRRSREL
jgi:hypothetical protein